MNHNESEMDAWIAPLSSTFLNSLVDDIKHRSARLTHHSISPLSTASRYKRLSNQEGRIIPIRIENETVPDSPLSPISSVSESRHKQLSLLSEKGRIPVVIDKDITPLSTSSMSPRFSSSESRFRQIPTLTPSTEGRIIPITVETSHHKHEEPSVKNVHEPIVIDEDPIKEVIRRSQPPTLAHSLSRVDSKIESDCVNLIDDSCYKPTCSPPVIVIKEDSFTNINDVIIKPLRYRNDLSNSNRNRTKNNDSNGGPSQQKSLIMLPDEDDIKSCASNDACKETTVLLSPSSSSSSTITTRSKSTSGSSSIEHDVNKAPSYPIYDMLQPILAEENRQIDYIKGDGNCFFRALSKQLYDSERYHKAIRSEVVDIIATNKDKFTQFVDGEHVQSHVKQMAQVGCWATSCEIYAAATLLQRDIYMLTPDPSNSKYSWLMFGRLFSIKETSEGPAHRCYISLCNTNGNHYDRVVPDHGGCNCFLPQPEMDGISCTVDLT